MAGAPASNARILGRYALGREIARGGLAAVHIGLRLGEAGFSRTVAIKALLPAFASDRELALSFVEEAKLAARIRHPNVVPTFDVVTLHDEVFLVMEYVHGESLASLIQAAKGLGMATPPAVASAIFLDVLRGLQAAHDATDEHGTPLGVVHRDMSPQNVLVGADGVGRVLDFGIAKAASRCQVTREGQVKGKLAYMPPEQLAQSAVQASDIYSTAACLWEALTMRRLFDGDNESAVLAKIIAGLVDAPSRHAAGLSPEVDALLLRALDRAPAKRFSSAREMADALESTLPPASTQEVREWVLAVAGVQLSRRLEMVSEFERAGRSLREKPPESRTEGADATMSAAPVVSAIAARESARWRPWAAGTAIIFGGAALVMGALRLSSNAALAEPASQPVTLPLGRIVVATLSSADPPGVPVTSLPSPSSSPAPNHAASPLKRTPARPPPQQGTSCDPPYSVDPDGTHRYKKACLR